MFKKGYYVYGGETMISYKEIPRLIDVSAVRTDVTYDELKLIAHLAEKYDFVCVFAMPCFTDKLRRLITKPTVMLGGVAGFPSGADTTESKIDCAKRMVELGCDEVDMVINVGALKSKDYLTVENDVKAVVKAVFPVPVKSILEISYLTDEEIKKGAELAVSAGVTYVKTGTGWASNPTTVDTIKLIKSVVGNHAKIKAAGGVRTLADLENMVDAGCDRFGISAKSALSILNEAYTREGIVFPDKELLENYDVSSVNY